MDYEALGRRVRMQRKLLGITQEELSERVGVSCSYIGLIERGDRKLSIETLVSLAEALRISCDNLLQDSLKNTMSSLKLMALPIQPMVTLECVEG